MEINMHQLTEAVTASKNTSAALLLRTGVTLLFSLTDAKFLNKVTYLLSYDNATLLAFAAVRRAAAPGGRCSRSIYPARQAHSSRSATAACSGGQMRQTYRRTPYRYTDPAAYYTVKK